MALRKVYVISVAPDLISIGRHRPRLGVSKGLIRGQVVSVINVWIIFYLYLLF